MNKFLVFTLSIALFLVACGGGTSDLPAVQVKGALVTAQATATRAPATRTPVSNTAVLKPEGTSEDTNVNAFTRVDNAAASPIQDVVMAKGVKPDTYEPVDVTTEFPADTSKFYAVVITRDAPPATMVRAQWVIVDVGELAPPETIITESEIEVEGTVNIGFSLTPDAGKLPGGSYKVNLFVDDVLDGSIGFQVVGKTRISNDVITRVVPFSAADANGEPVDNGGRFPAGVSELAVAVYYINAPAQTNIKGIWTAVDLGGIVPNNTRLATTEKDVQGSSELTLSITNSTALPDGTYQVEISANNKLFQSVELTVGGAAPSSPPSQPAANTGKIEHIGDVKLEPAPDALAGLALDKQGNVYVGIVGGLLKVAPDGSQTKFGELGDAFHAQDNKFIAVNAMAVNDAGSVYTIDTAASVAQKGDATGKFHTWGDSELYQPFGIALDGQGNVYIADTYNRRVAKFDPGGKLLAEFSNVAGGMAPLGIVVSPSNNIIVTDGLAHRIVILDPQGNFLGEFGKQGTGEVEFDQPVALALYDNDLYVVDAGNRRVQVIDNQGKFVTQFGDFSQPRQIAISADGTIYVSDYGTHSIQKYRAGGAAAKPGPSPQSSAGPDPADGTILVDTGFRPARDGFGFENYGGEYPKQQGDVYVEDLIRMFGESAVCAGYKDGQCQVAPGMLKYADAINEASNNGHCEGMAVLSMRFFQKKESPQDFEPNAQTVFDLKLEGNSALRREIMYYFALQATAPTFTLKNDSLQKKPSQVLDDIIADLKKGDPVSIAIRQAGVGGHAVAPYAVQDRGNGIYYVWIYDNNWPGEARYIEVNRPAETWKYSFGALNPSKPPVFFQGDATTHTFGAVPLSAREEPPQCLFCADATAKSADALTQITLFGEGDLLITNAQGKRLGFVDGTFVNEIPGADSYMLDTGLGIDSEPVYFVPTNGKYDIALAGSDTQPTDANLYIFGGGAAIEFDNISLAPGEQDRLSLDPANLDLSYYAAGEQSPGIDLAIDGADNDYLFSFDGLSFESGETIGFNLQGNQLALASDNGGADDTYSFEFTSVGDDGTQEFANDSVAFGEDDTQYLDYGDWNGDDEDFSIGIDENGDGAIDQKLTEVDQH